MNKISKGANIQYFIIYVFRTSINLLTFEINYNSLGLFNIKNFLALLGLAPYF